MKTHRELLQAAFDDAQRNVQATDAETSRLRRELESTKDAIASLEERYSNACVESARGNTKAEDPGSLIERRDRLSHTLRGFEQLYAEAGTKAQAASMKLQEASKTLQACVDQEELEKLMAAQSDAISKRDEAQRVLNEAEQEVRSTGFFVNQFRRKLERNKSVVA